MVGSAISFPFSSVYPPPIAVTFEKISPVFSTVIVPFCGVFFFSVFTIVTPFSSLVFSAVMSKYTGVLSRIYPYRA